MKEDARRIAIVGSGGAGKSTLARQLGELLHLPVFHLDALLWRPGWMMTPRDEEIVILNELLAREEWIIDGNYGSTMSARFAAADAVILLDFPRGLCLWRVLKRRVQYHGKTRPDMGPGCPEQLDWEFLRWIWRFPQDSRPMILQRLRESCGEASFTILHRPHEIEEFLHLVEAKQYAGRAS